jgi:hypothetical protein
MEITNLKNENETLKNNLKNLKLKLNLLFYIKLFFHQNLRHNIININISLS